MADRTLNLGTLFTAEVGDFLSKTDQIINRLRTMHTAMNQAFGKTGGFGAATSGMNQVTTAANKTTQAVQAQAKNLTLLERGWLNLRKALSIVTTYGLAFRVIQGVTEAFKAGGQAIANYDQSLKSLQAVTQATDTEVTKMGEAIKSVSKDTRLSVTDVSEGMQLLGQAGFDATQSIQTIQAAANLSVGTLEDMFMSVDLLSSAIFAFQLRAFESARVADVMANAINRSKLDVEKLRVAFNYVGAVAKDAGMSLEQTAASMMLLSNAGIRASTIGTGLRQVVSRLLSPNRALREEFEALGISLEEMNPATQGFEKVLERLSKVLVDQNTKVVDIAKAYRLFGLRGAQTAAILTRSFATGAYQDMLEKTYEVGSANEMAAKQMEGLVAKIENLGTRAQLLAIAFGEAGITRAVKVFIDILRTAVQVLTDFANSIVGKALINFVVWTAAIYAFVKSVDLAVKGLKYLAAAMTATSKYMTVLTTTTVVSGDKLTRFGVVLLAAKQYLIDFGRFLVEMAKRMTGFGTATTQVVTSVSVVQQKVAAWYAGLGKIGPLLKVAAVVAGITMVVDYWAKSTERAIKKQTEITDAAKDAHEALETYRGALITIGQNMEKGRNVNAEYKATLQRLIEAYPTLKGKIVETTAALKDNLATIKEYERLELTKYISGLMKELDLYKKKIAEAEFFTGLGKLVESFISKVNDSLVRFLMAIPNLLMDLNNLLLYISSKGLTVLANALKAIGVGGKVFETLTGWANTLEGSIYNLTDRIRTYGKDSKQAKDATEEFTKKLIETGLAIKKMRPDIGTEVMLSEMKKQYGATEEQIQRVRRAVADMGFSFKEAVEKSDQELSKLPASFKKFYDSLAPLEKVAFAETRAQIDKEVAAFRDKHNLISEDKKALYEGIAAIEAEHLTKFMKNQTKEEMSVRESTEKQLQLIEEMLKSKEEAIIESARRQRAALAIEYDRAAAKGDTQQMEQIRREAVAATKQLEEELAGVRAGYRAQASRVLLNQERELNNEIKKLYKEQTDSFLTEARNRYKEYLDLAKKAEDDIKKMRESREDIIRRIRQKGMTEEQRYNDDIKAYHEAMNKARSTGDAEYYKKAIDLAEGLAKEVKTGTGDQEQTIISLGEAVRRSEAMAEEAIQGYIRAKEKEKQTNEVAAYNINKSITDVENKVREYMKTVDEASQKALELNTTHAIESMEQTYDIVAKFKEKWDDIKSKTITLNVVYNYPKGGADGGGKDSESVKVETEGGASSDSGNSANKYRWGGMVVDRAKEAVRNFFTYAKRGLKLPGYGGGDRVPVMAESGEYIINKESTKKFLPFIEAINQDTISSFGKRFGGFVNSIKLPKVPNYQKFAMGGAVASGGGGNSTLNLSIKIKPTYMSGDRASARRLASDIYRELEELGIRRGV
jgi:TP901 family phage tail tape measure protein